MLNLLISMLASLFLLAGLILLVSPLPVGVFFIAIGLSGLIYANTTAQKWVKNWRIKYPSFNGRLHRLEARISGKLQFITDALQQTHPEQHTHQGSAKSADKHFIE